MALVFRAYLVEMQGCAVTVKTATFSSSAPEAQSQVHVSRDF